MNTPRTTVAPRSFFPNIKVPNAPRVLSVLTRLSIAPITVLLATLCKMHLDVWLGSYAPFMLYFTAVAVSAWFGGFGTGLSASGLSAIIYSVLFSPHEPHQSPLQAPTWTLIYFIISSLLAALIGRTRSLQMNSVVVARALKESEERYRRVLETAFEGIWIVDAQGHTSYVNEHVVQMLGYSREEIAEHVALDFVDESDRHAALSQQDKRREGERTQYEMPLRRKDGSKVWTLISSTPLTDKSGKFQGGLAMITDITALKKAEQSLKQGEERYRNFVAQSSEAIWCFELEKPLSPNSSEQEQLDAIFKHGCLTECNDVMAQMYGYERAEEIVGARVPDMLPPNEENLAYLRAFLRSGYRLTDAETQEIDRYGRTKYFINNLVGMTNERGELVRAWGTQRDITPLKEAEAERLLLLQREREARISAESARRRWEFMADASAIMASAGGYEENLKRVAERAVTAEEGQIAIADWCGVELLQEDGTMRRLALMHADPEMRELARRAAAISDNAPPPSEAVGALKAIETGKTFLYRTVPDSVLDFSAQSPEHRKMLEDLKICSALFAPLLSRERVLGVVSFGVSDASRAYSEDDVAFGDSLARRLALAIDNEQLLLEAQAGNRSKDQFLATLSHELRTPLNAILGWSHLLNSGVLDEDAMKNATATIERNARLQAQLVEDLLDFSRIVGGRMKIDNEPISLNTIVREAIDTVHPAAAAKEITIEYSNEVDLRQEDADVVCGDERRLQQVSWNLLSNAIKFTPQNGRVDVTLSRRKNEITLCVADNGKGIEAEFLPYVWEQFRQADASSTRRFGGMGLGLSIVKSMAELHGGHVDVKSEGADKGSMFIITFPAMNSSTELPIV